MTISRSHRLVMVLCSLLALHITSPVHADAGTTRAATAQDEDNAAIFAGETDDPRLLAQRAYVWGMPLVEAALIRLRTTVGNADPTSVKHTRLNHFVHQRRLAGPDFQVGVGPNNDTVYSLAWLDLSGGPFVLQAPDFGDRYYTFSFNFADSSAEQSLGQRTHGAQLPPVFIQGPLGEMPVPQGMVGVRSPTRYLNLAGRFLVADTQDYPEVHALQDQLRLRPWSAYEAGLPAPEDAPPQRPLLDPVAPISGELAFFEMLGNVLKDWVIESRDTALVASFSRIGLTPQDGFVPTKIDEATRAEILKGLQDGKHAVQARSLHLGIERNGWTINLKGPRFGDNFLLRAAVAKDQIYVAIPEEAVYPIGRMDDSGRMLDGGNAYRIRIAANEQPPVEAFWSITAYDDKGRMVPNPIDRYSIGDRTRGLVSNTEGTIDILLQHAPPPDDEIGNWLPVPDAPFYLMMRLYIPDPPVLNATWVPPPIERVGP